MSKLTVVGEEAKGISGVRWDCPICGDENYDYPGERLCQYCNTEITVKDPISQDE